MALGAVFFARGWWLIFVVGCSSEAGEDSQSVTRGFRDWKAHPAIVEIDDATDVFAVSDVHGEYDRFVALLAANHLIDSKGQWSGGSAILVVDGDMIDKGPKSLEVLDLVRRLQASAPHVGGHVIATLGNHEAEFMADPENHKATSTGLDAVGIDNELATNHITPQSLASRKDSRGRGAWMANLPFGVRIKNWFFAHGGNTQKLSIQDLASKLSHSLDHHGWSDSDIIGKSSILEAQSWYGNPDDDNAGAKEADALGVKHIVFGHDPGAFGEHGHVLASKNGVLVKIDTAMGIHDRSTVGRAFLLHIETQGKDTAEVLDDTGTATPLL